MIRRSIVVATLLVAVVALATVGHGDTKWGRPAPTAYQSGALAPESSTWAAAPTPDRIWAPPGTGLQLIIPRDPR